jgi:hypothetical protein
MIRMAKQDYASAMTPRLLPALILALAALPAHAEVYKWVDAKGQVNYSNAPPPSVAGKAQVVEEQISVMGMDPAVRAWAEQRFAAQERQEERDWQQRQQRAMYTQPVYTPPSSTSYGSSYSGDYYPYYGGGYYYGGYVQRPLRQHHHHRPVHHRTGVWSPPRPTPHATSTGFRGSRHSRR